MTPFVGLDPVDVAEALAVVLQDIRNGSLVASETTEARLEGAYLALKALSEDGPVALEELAVPGQLHNTDV